VHHGFYGPYRHYGGWYRPFPSSYSGTFPYYSPFPYWWLS
jgi:hypothetical protein